MSSDDTKSAKFTPGPWRWLGDSVLMADHGKRDAIIAPCCDWEGNGAYMGEWKPDGRVGRLDPDGPNAQLLASAPDLYAAVLVLLDATDSGDPALVKTAADLARAALAKARAQGGA